MPKTCQLKIDLTGNLMLDGCIHTSSKQLVIEQAPANQLYTYLGGFEKCLIAAEKMKTG